jgi:APA family basic amino acid/polyamine antiporter
MKLLHFEKKLGLAGALSVTVGAVIGVGIFVIVGPIGALCGAWMPVAFAAATIPAIFGALVAAALGGTIPADGGGFYYTRCLLGRYAGVTASALVVLGAMGALGAVATGVADYLSVYVPGLPRPLVAIALILGSWGINAVGIMASEKFQIAMVAQLVSALLLVIVAAVLGGGNPDFAEPLPQGTGGFLQGAVLAVLTFVGFNILGELGDEVEKPHRTIPLTIGLGLGIIAVIYIGVGWVVAGTLSPTELEESRVALLDVSLRHLPGWTTHYLNLAAVAGAVTSINAVFLAVPRELSALSEEGVLPRWIMRFDAERQTFPVGIALVAVAGCAIILLDLDVDIWGLVTVAGLMLASVFFALGAFRLFARYPDEVAASPLRLRPLWVFPSSALSAVSSLAFGALAVVFYWPVGVVAGGMVAGALWLCWRRTRNPTSRGKREGGEDG